MIRALFGAGTKLGLAVCVNDGDTGSNGEDIGEGGQTGWSGWGPYALVYGKNSAQAGLVTLGQAPAPLCPTQESCASTSGNWGLIPAPVATRMCPATIACSNADEYLWGSGTFQRCPNTCGLPASTVTRPVSCELGARPGLKAWCVLPPHSARILQSCMCSCGSS